VREVKSLSLSNRRTLAVLLFASVLLVALAAWSRSIERTALAAPVAAGTEPSLQGQAPGRVQQTVTARRYTFSPDRIEVEEGDLVKITLQTEDIPHSFTIDAYRIAKRAAPDQPVTFEFQADQQGVFPFYCNLTADPGCRHMQGQLVVRPKAP
jgi:heme/copper-type cytochrome/quinol oxidase subunit 2